MNTQTPMSWLEASIALITGGGSGLGRALVERFLQEGTRVGVLESNAERAKTLAEEFGACGIVNVCGGEAL